MLHDSTVFVRTWPGTRIAQIRPIRQDGFDGLLGKIMSNFIQVVAIQSLLPDTPDGHTFVSIISRVQDLGRISSQVLVILVLTDRANN